jgi:hypothetical protein
MKDLINTENREKPVITKFGVFKKQRAKAPERFFKAVQELRKKKDQEKAQEI